MTYSTDDTDWEESQAGNQWRRLNGIVLIVGKRKHERHYWASVELKYLDDVFATVAQAKAAAEAELNRLENNWFREHGHDC